MLYEDDSGDLDKRQDKIERFVDEANKLLEKYERRKWKFKQDFRSVLAYILHFANPRKTIFISPPNVSFFRYLEYGKDMPQIVSAIRTFMEPAARINNNGIVDELLK